MRVARVDLLPCDSGALLHRHSRRCLHLLGSRLPVPPVGWRWDWGRIGAGWGVWLVSVGDGRTWHPVGFGVMRSAGELAYQMHALAVGSISPRLQ